MKGKEKCKALKEIRMQIATTNDIPFAVSECTHQGDCRGTCPKCESELKYLERELAIRQGLGKAVAVVGISVGACSALTACSPMDLFNGGGYSDLAGDIAPLEGEMIDGGIEISIPESEINLKLESETNTIPSIDLNEIEGKMVAPEESTPPITEGQQKLPLIIDKLGIEGDIAVYEDIQ